MRGVRRMSVYFLHYQCEIDGERSRGTLGVSDSSFLLLASSSPPLSLVTSSNHDTNSCIAEYQEKPSSRALTLCPFLLISLETKRKRKKGGRKEGRREPSQFIL